MEKFSDFHELSNALQNEERWPEAFRMLSCFLFLAINVAERERVTVLFETRDTRRMAGELAAKAPVEAMRFALDFHGAMGVEINGFGHFASYKARISPNRNHNAIFTGNNSSVEFEFINVRLAWDRKFRMGRP